MLSYITIRHSLLVFYLEGRIDFGVGVESEFDKHCYHYYEFFFIIFIKKCFTIREKRLHRRQNFLNLRRF